MWGRGLGDYSSLNTPHPVEGPYDTMPGRSCDIFGLVVGQSLGFRERFFTED